MVAATGAVAFAATGEHGLSQKAVEIARPFGFPITNSMVVTWFVAVLLVVFAQVATRTMQQVPRGAQNFLEWIVDGLYAFLEGILGRHLVDRTFWFFASIFSFSLEQPLLRGANADVNMTLAMALVFFASWIVWGLQEVGPIGFFKELFAPKGESAGALRVLLVVVFFAAGCLEVVSILFRPVSLSFRLYGNIFAGETMLETMARMPKIGWLVQVPFYFLELLVGIVQALVFMLLTAVFTLLLCQHHEGPSTAHH
jgi:F-type H+-transporting ATPase subunit a